MKTSSKAQNAIVREKLRRARRRTSPRPPISQQELADLAGISQSQLSLFELGQRDLDRATLGDLEHALMKLARIKVGQMLEALVEAV